MQEVRLKKNILLELIILRSRTPFLHDIKPKHLCLLISRLLTRSFYGAQKLFISIILSSINSCVCQLSVSDQTIY